MDRVCGSASEVARIAFEAIATLPAAELSAALDEIRSELIRYPALDAEAFERRVGGFLDDD